MFFIAVNFSYQILHTNNEEWEDSQVSQKHCGDCGFNENWAKKNQKESTKIRITEFYFFL